MDIIELKLRALISDETSFHLLKLVLELMGERKMGSTIPYDQSSVCDELDESYPDQYCKLKSLKLRFSGLCELVSNAVIADNLMGHQDHIFTSHLEKFNKKRLSVKPSGERSIQLVYKALNHVRNPYDKISLMHLNAFSNTHSLDVASYFQHMFSYFLGVYPFDLFSFEDKVQVGRHVDEVVLGNKLDTLDEGSYIKFMTFSMTWTGFQGHSMVIKKTGNTFSFFDPNEGETFGLSLSRLCERINGCMDSGLRPYDRMAFVDGNQFIQHVNGLIQSDTITEAHPEQEEQPLVQEGIIPLILSELEKIVALGRCTDEDLVSMMDGIRVKIEQLLQGQEPSEVERAYVITNESIHSMDSCHYSRDIADKKLAELDRIRFSTSNQFLDDQVREMKQRFCDICNFELLFQSLKSPYDVGVLFRRLSVENCQKACESPRVEFDKIIKTTRDIHVVFKYLQDEYGEGGILKCTLVYNAIKTRLHERVHSAHDLEILLSVFSPEQRTEFMNEAMLDRLPDLIHTADDLADVFHYLTPEERRVLFDQIKDRLPEIIHDSNNAAYAFQRAIGALLSDQRAVFFDEMQDKLSLLVFEDLSEYEMLLGVLDPERDEKFKRFMEKNLSEIKVKTVMNQIKSELYHHDSAWCEGLYTLFKQTPQEGLRELIFEAMVKQLDVPKTSNSQSQLSFKLSEILPALSSQQYEKFSAHEAVQDALKTRLKNNLEIPVNVAESLSVAFLSNNDERIKTAFDRLIQNDIQYNCSPLDFFSPQLIRPYSLRNIKQLQPYWLKKVNKALQLGLDDEQLTKADFCRSFGEYCDRQLVKSNAFVEIKTSIHELKSDSRADDKTESNGKASAQSGKPSA